MVIYDLYPRSLRRFFDPLIAILRSTLVYSTARMRSK